MNLMAVYFRAFQKKYDDRNTCAPMDRMAHFLLLPRNYKGLQEGLVHLWTPRSISFYLRKYLDGGWGGPQNLCKTQGNERQKNHSHRGSRGTKGTNEIP